MNGAVKWESLVDDLRNAFTGDIRDLADGVRVMVNGQQACAMYRPANASGNQYELKAGGSLGRRLFSSRG